MRPVRLLLTAALACMVAGVSVTRASIDGKTPPLPVAKRLSPTASQAPIVVAEREAHRTAGPAAAKDVDNSQLIDINQIAMYVTNTGSFAWDKTTGNAGLEYPKGTAKTAVFAAGLWMAGRVGGQTRVAVSEYSDEYGPGAMVGTAPDDPNKAEYHVYKLYRTYTDDATRDAALADYNAGAVPHGAPAVTVQSDGSLDILGDEMLWAVYNDADPVNHTNRAGSTAPMGVEVQQTTFAFNRQGALGSTVFIRYKLINKGGNTIDSMYVSQWSDPDDGYAGDDLDGCDTTLSVGYCYNGTNFDNIYGAQVPAVGYDFFQGPKVGGVPLPMTSFNKYINGTDPDNYTKTYNLMKGLQQDGSPLINPTNGQVTTFMLSGDPVLGSGWLDTNPADRRLQCSSGPFTMAPGDTQVVTTAIVIGQSKNRLASISLMKFYDSEAQAAFDADFSLAAPPNQPNVTANPINGGVRLTWAVNSESYNQPPYVWEGYVVYQGASVAGPWTRLGTFDRVDGITTVLDNDFNEEQGLILPTGKAFGTDAGTQYSMDITTDAVRGGPLHNATPYYFSVNAYSVGLGETPQVLESAYNPITVVPQTPAAGVDPGSASITTPIGNQYQTGTNPTTDVITATIVDPMQVKTADYKMGFKPVSATSTEMSWYVVRTMGAAVDTVVNNWTDFVADQQNPVFDGIQVTDLSYPLGQLARVQYVPVGGGTPALEGVDVGLRFFGGGSDYANELFGSAIATGDTAHSHNVEIRFSTTVTQDAYHYLRHSGQAGTYPVQDYVPVPFQVWDTDTNTQLNVGFLENADDPTYDGMWDPDNSALGGREILWIFDDAYSGDGTPDPTYMTTYPDAYDNAGDLPFRYVVWPALSSAGATIADGDKLVFTTSVPATPNDYFTFSTTAANRFDAALAKDQLSQVLAVPNPYFNRSTYELTQFSRVVKFTHLPATCTIRIFNLAGDLVRTLHKNDSTSETSWDLQTDRGLPVSSGVYIFHVDAPGVGTKVGKVAIFMEKERLNTF